MSETRLGLSLAVGDSRKEADTVFWGGDIAFAGVLLVAAVRGSDARWFLVSAVGGVVLVGFWLTRRGVRAIDESATEQVGDSTVVDAFERYAAVHSMEPSRRRLPNPLSVNVALGDRIDQLRA